MRLSVQCSVIYYRNENLIHLYKSCSLTVFLILEIWLIEMTQIFDRLPNDKILHLESNIMGWQRRVYPVYALVVWLLILWRREMPRIQRIWYWLYYYTEIFCSSERLKIMITTISKAVDASYKATCCQIFLSIIFDNRWHVCIDLYLVCSCLSDVNECWSHIIIKSNCFIHY